jgi:hypothetical protein
MNLQERLKKVEEMFAKVEEERNMLLKEVQRKEKKMLMLKGAFEELNYLLKNSK